MLQEARFGQLSLATFGKFNELQRTITYNDNVAPTELRVYLFRHFPHTHILLGMPSMPRSMSQISHTWLNLMGKNTRISQYLAAL
jgi:hypothetical protein